VFIHKIEEKNKGDKKENNIIINDANNLKINC